MKTRMLTLIFNMFTLRILWDIQGFPGGASGKEPENQCRRHKRHGFNPWVRKIPLEKEMATHSSSLTCKIPQTEEPGGLQPMGLQESDMTL